MSEPIDLPLDAGDRLYDPPLVDCLYYDDQRRAYVVTFVPSDDVSESPTELVVLHENGVEFRRVNALFTEVNRILAPDDILNKVVHSGGGNYVLHLRSGATLTLADEPSNSSVVQAADRLKQIAEAAEIAFRVAHPA